MALQFQGMKMGLLKVEIELCYLIIMKQAQRRKWMNAMFWIAQPNIRQAKATVTLSLIFGELGECHVSPIQVWQWIKQESINIPISFRCLNSFTAFNKELRKPDNDNFLSYPSLSMDTTFRSQVKSSLLSYATVQSSIGVFESNPIERLQKLITFV